MVGGALPLLSCISYRPGLPAGLQSKENLFLMETNQEANPWNKWTPHMSHFDANKKRMSFTMHNNLNKKNNAWDSILCWKALCCISCQFFYALGQLLMKCLSVSVKISQEKITFRSICRYMGVARKCWAIHRWRRFCQAELALPEHTRVDLVQPYFFKMCQWNASRVKTTRQYTF